MKPAKTSLSTRRGFISACAACGACFALKPVSFLSAAPVSGTKKRLKIRNIYSLHSLQQTKPDWPNVGFDFAPFIETTNSTLTNQFPEYDFFSSLATGQEDAEKIIADDAKENIDGYIVFQMNCWNQVVQTAAKSGKPVLYVDFQFGGSGGFLVYTSAFLRDKTPNVGFVASSRTHDLLGAVGCFDIISKGGTAAEFAAATRNVRLKATPLPGNMSCKADNLKAVSTEECLKKNRESRILVARDQKTGTADPILGIPVEYITFAELNKAWETANPYEAQRIVEKWQKNSSAINDVSPGTLQTSAAMYLGMKSVLKNHNANAITVNCLGGFYGGHIQAYPCLGFHELLNEGLVGACEADVRSTATMVIFTNMTGRPGYISDPVIDTSKRQIIYAHCVASNKAFGPDGPVNPFTIMTHSDDRQGASVRSILPVDYMTTSLEVDASKKEILFHQAKAVANDPDDRACRTKICAEPVGDIEKLFGQWSAWGWHRVTFYGDLKEHVFALADTAGWKVVEEA